ncbi:MAG: hypothetical protein KZQ64_13650 [gamma proteobacterium symbiont of Bathyaustriella thionipta]|nr:hypothetical protein [gamma proteobacterium symbiont of Bathyaustriella thionipta]MCU7949274.1 hypothetical protein [gamma proteobacterium symbiont of Bathyaustriella thionipta]MCU7954414.1 hypothetical protein [gamma proteobacterium symbiont of Bathyaustriella thionipta]MCU7955865.1 hypothetical protein [gamma proteobacterium symbiont of Bathyaustriella thionipta]MCU7967547.1 hypothetical protein [gamma proteobacterium symbiont of Bathyaustriella thionipta]
MPDELQPMTLAQISRVLKPCGKFKLLEMMYSKNEAIRRRKEIFTPFVEKVYGARFDRKTAQFIEQSVDLEFTR